MEKGHGEFKQVGEKVVTKTVEGGFAGLDETADAEEGDGSLEGEDAEELEDDAVGLGEDGGGIDSLAKGISGVADELLEVIGKGEREAGGDEQRGKGGQENFFLTKEVGEDPTVGGEWQSFFRGRHVDRGTDDGRGVNGGEWKGWLVQERFGFSSDPGLLKRGHEKNPDCC